jgi:small subunit ribosomal protein S2
MAAITLEELMQAGVHFGHQTSRWNPRMKPFIYCKRNGIHILDLTKTVVLFEQAYEYVKQVSAQGKKVLFVGCKKQAADIVAAEANRVGALFVNKRWLGGTLTNATVIKGRIAKLRELEELESSGQMDKLPAKECAVQRRTLAKMRRAFGGLIDMRGEVGAIVVIDQKRELNAVLESRKAGVPVICLLDSNADPTLCDYGIPGNDDALKAITLVVGRLADAVEEGKALREANQQAQKDANRINAEAPKAPVAVGAPSEPTPAADEAPSA